MDSKPDIVISDPAAGAPTVRWGIVGKVYLSLSHEIVSLLI